MRPIAGGIASVLALTSAIAQAQTAPAGEIVVTAQKRSQGINDVPIAISAFTGVKLADSGVKSLETLSDVTPGLTISNTAATGVPIYTIRGIGFSDYSTSASSTVGVYTDEVALPYAVMTRGVFFDVGQVEVLKGPQGDLYGRNSTAGQINVNSARPTETLAAGASAEISNWGETSLEGFISGPLAQGLKGRIAAKVDEGGAWQQSITRPGDKLGNKDVVAVRGSLDWQASPALDVFASAHYIVDKSDNQAPTAYDGSLIGQSTLRLPVITSTAAGNPSSDFSTGNNRLADWTDGALKPRRDNKLAGFVVKANLDLGAATLNSVTGYDHFERREANSWDGWIGNDSKNINSTQLNVFSQELRLASKDNGPLSWIVGAYYSHDVMHEDYAYFMQQSFYALALGIQTLDTRYDQTTTSLAGFAHAEYKLGHGWRLIGGFRYTHEKRAWSGCTYDSGDGTLAAFVGGAPGSCGTYDDLVGTPGYGTNAVYSDTITANRAMWRAGIDKKVGRSLYYATVSTGFKSGGFSGINTNLASQLLPYQPETVTAYEVGTKLAIPAAGLHINASAFWYDYKNKQETNFINTFVGALAQLTNVPRSRIRGVELDGVWQATPTLSFTASTTYLDAVITNWANAGLVNAANVAVPTNLAGARLANAPRWQSNAAATYEVPVSATLRAFVTGDVAQRATYSGEILELNPATAVPGYAIFDARAGVKSQDGKWQVSLWVRNLADHYYYTSAFFGNSIYVRMNGMPRTFGLSARVNF
jgi:iron complex outermembrane receptor protein